VIENQLFVKSPPSPDHQEASGDLFTDINVFVRKNKLGKVFFAPLDLYLDEGISKNYTSTVRLSLSKSFHVTRKPTSRFRQAQPDRVFRGAHEHSNVVQPDILFIAKTNPLVIDKKGLKGVPDLIIEILSPGNKKYDSVKKKNVYEKFGVKEYWIVDLETKMATGFLLKGSTYVSQKELHNEIRSSILGEKFSF
jgi:Uma2 family endonuclease